MTAADQIREAVDAERERLADALKVNEEQAEQIAALEQLLERVLTAGFGRTELPIRVYDGDKGLVLACLCDAETARVRLGTVNESMISLRSSGGRRHQAVADVSPAAVLVLAGHASQCKAGRLRLAVRRREAAAAARAS